MDILSMAPLEIADQILGHLDGEDLWNCLSVSKSWRSLSNRRRHWKPLCLKIGVPLKKLRDYDEEAEEENDMGNFGLCAAAGRWFRQRKLMSCWYHGKWKKLYWPRHRDPKAYTIYENRLAVRTDHEIYIYFIREEGTLKIDTIRLPWNCFFEYRLMEMNAKYVIVGFNNVILVYELNNTYNLKLAYTFNKEAAVARKYIHDFIRTERNTFFVNILKIIRLTGDSLWVKVKYMYFHATFFHIDLLTGKATNVFPYRNVKFLCGSDDIFMFREEEDEVILIRAKGGELLNRLSVGRYYALAGNDKMIAVNKEQGLAIFDINTGKNLVNISTGTLYRYIAVNPLSDVVYCLHEDCCSRRDVFTSYSMSTGKMLWSQILAVKIPEIFRWNTVSITVLFGSLIIIKSGGPDPPFLDDLGSLKREYFVFDANTGNLLHHKGYEKFLLFTESYVCDKNYLRSAI